MINISQHVGQRIRKYRKSKRMTIMDFSDKINKSKATLSKYENGTITIDIETLLDIANALEIDLINLIDYKSPYANIKQFSKNVYFNKPEYYIYYFDGRQKKIIKSLLTLNPSHQDDSDINVTLYNRIEDFNYPEKCHHFYTGNLVSYDTVTHIYLTNQINVTEKAYLCILNPNRANSPATIGMYAGLGTDSFFAPVAFKLLVSREILEPNDEMLSIIKLDKDDYRNYRYYNMMVINRPTSLFVTENHKEK